MRLQSDAGASFHAMLAPSNPLIHCAGLQLVVFIPPISMDVSSLLNSILVQVQHRSNPPLYPPQTNRAHIALPAPYKLFSSLHGHQVHMSLSTVLHRQCFDTGVSALDDLDHTMADNYPCDAANIVPHIQTIADPSNRRF